MLALGIYLRRFFIDYLEKEYEVALDTQSFGKFALINDEEATEESLYPKKFIYEPNQTKVGE